MRAVFAFDLTLGPHESKSLKRPGKASFDTVKLSYRSKASQYFLSLFTQSELLKIENIFIFFVVQNDDTAKLCVKAKKLGSPFHKENHIRLCLCS